MRYKATLCYSLLCALLCLVPRTGLCQAESTQAAFSLEKAVEGALFVERLPDDVVAESFMGTLENIVYSSISDGKTMTFPFNYEGKEIRYRTLDLDTLQESNDLTLRTFDEGETLLRVLPRMGGFFALTTRALLCYDGTLKLKKTAPLPDALIGMEGFEGILRLNGQVNQDGTLILFEAVGQDAGIYLCALEPDAVPYLLLAGTTYADANGNALEGYREGRFVSEDRVCAYLWDKDRRIAYELFDLEGRRLYQSFVFNQQASSRDSDNASLEESRGCEVEGADGVLLGSPTSLDTWDAFYYFDYQTLQLDRMTSWALDQTRLQICALNGTLCIFAVTDWNLDTGRRSEVRFFTLNLSATDEAHELPFSLHDVAQFTAALAPGGRILFVGRDYASGVFFRGVFQIQ